MSSVTAPESLYSGVSNDQLGFFLYNSETDTRCYSSFAEEFRLLVSLGYEQQDYFNFQPPENRNGAGYLQYDAYPDMFLHDPDLLQPEDPFVFNDTWRTPMDLGLRFTGSTDQFQHPGTAQKNASDAPKPQLLTIDLNNWAVRAYPVSPGAFAAQSGDPLRLSRLEQPAGACKKETFNTARLPPDSPLTTEASDAAPAREAGNETTKGSKREADMQGLVRGKKARRVRKSKKLVVISKEDQQARRKLFLEKNRNAAAKCRARSKQSEAKLKDTFERMTVRRGALDTQLAELKDQYAELEAMLLPHCQVCPLKNLKDWVEALPRGGLVQSSKSIGKPLQLGDDNLEIIL
jgi:hypothetical protein